jgi:hypothetical protein
LTYNIIFFFFVLFRDILGVIAPMAPFISMPTPTNSLHFFYIYWSKVYKIVEKILFVLYLLPVVYCVLRLVTEAKYILCILLVSLKKYNVLSKIKSNLTQNRLKQLCPTRLIGRHDSIIFFLELSDAIIDSLWYLNWQ